MQNKVEAFADFFSEVISEMLFEERMMDTGGWKT